MERNALLVNISSANAVKSAEALSSLVVTGPDRVPKVVTWRCRDVHGKMGVHTGIVRSQTDASNTTIHAVRVGGVSGHCAALWSVAVRNATPHDAATSLVAGVSEGLLHHNLVDTGRLPLRNKHHKTRVLDSVNSVTEHPYLQLLNPHLSY